MPWVSLIGLGRELAEAIRWLVAQIRKDQNARAQLLDFIEEQRVRQFEEDMRLLEEAWRNRETKS